MKRTVEVLGWTITQVLQKDGSWWNIHVERTTTSARKYDEARYDLAHSFRKDS